MLSGRPDLGPRQTADRVLTNPLQCERTCELQRGSSMAKGQRPVESPPSCPFSGGASVPTRPGGEVTTISRNLSLIHQRRISASRRIKSFGSRSSGFPVPSLQIRTGSPGRCWLEASTSVAPRGMCNTARPEFRVNVPGLSLGLVSAVSLRMRAIAPVPTSACGLHKAGHRASWGCER